MPELAVNLSEIIELFCHCRSTDRKESFSQRKFDQLNHFFIGVGRESLRDFDKTVGKTSMVK